MGDNLVIIINNRIILINVNLVVLMDLLDKNVVILNNKDKIQNYFDLDEITIVINEMFYRNLDEHYNVHYLEIVNKNYLINFSFFV